MTVSQREIQSEPSEVILQHSDSNTSRTGKDFYRVKPIYNPWET